jgi:plastocyanin
MRKTRILFAAAALIALNATAFSAYAQALSLTIKDHKFEPAELKIPAGKEIAINVKNMDKTPEEIESSDLGLEKVIPANSEGTIHLHSLKPGKYNFVGEYHEDTAKGLITVE